MTRRVLVSSDVLRGGPRGAWWVQVTPRRHGPTGISLELPAGRARAWNAAAVLFAAGDLYAAHRLGVLGWLLAAIAVMVTAGAVNIARLTPRRSALDVRPVNSEEAEEHARVAAWIAARHAAPVQPPEHEVAA